MRHLALLIACAAVLSSPSADAHTPGRFRTGEAFVPGDPTDSFALYGDFETGEERFVVALTLRERYAVPVEVFVPHQAALANHRPAWALVGPGLPAPSAEELAALPVSLPAGFGAVVDLNTVTPRPVFYEFVMRRFYWSSGAMNVVFPEGASELWVWSPNKTTGKFGLGFGVEEGGGYMAALKDWCFYAY
jgi:hypothetical protein